MPPVVAIFAAVGSAIAAVGSAVAGVVGAVTAFAAAHATLWTIGKIVLSVAFLAISAHNAKKAAAGQLNQGQQLQMKLDPAMPRQILLGEIATGGSAVYAFSYTDDSSVPNKYLVRVTTLSDIPCDGLVAIREADQTLTFSGDLTADLQPCTSHHKNKAGDPCLYAKLHLGSYTPTADDWLIAHEPNGKWTADHKGVGACYVITRMTYDPDGDAWPQGEPALYYVMRGAKLYDQREDDTRINPVRTGSQRVDDPSSWSYSNNTSVILQHALRGFFLGGTLLMGAGATDHDLGDSMLLSAYNVCDQVVTNSDDSTEPRYTSGYVIQADQAVAQCITELTNAMDGDLFDRGGQITLLPGASRTPVMDLDDEDIIWSEEKSYQPLASLDSLYNTVVGQYVSAPEGYTQQPYPIKTDATYISDDGDERITLRRDFGAITGANQIQRVTARLLKKSRYQTIIGFVGPFWLWELEEGDWFTLTSARWGFERKTFWVQTCQLSSDMKVVLIAQEISSAIDNFDPAEDFQEPGDQSGSGSDGGGYVEAGASVSAITLTGDDGVTQIPAIRYTVTNGTATGIHVRLRLAGAAAPYITAPDLTLSGGSATGTYSSGLIPSTDYEVSFQPFTATSTGDWGAWHAVTTTSTLVVPGTATGAITATGLTMNTGKILGRASAGSGAIQELTPSSRISLSGGTVEVVQSTGKLLGRTTASSGATEEITPSSSHFIMSSGVLQAAIGDVADFAGVANTSAPGAVTITYRNPRGMAYDHCIIYRSLTTNFVDAIACTGNIKGGLGVDQSVVVTSGVGNNFWIIPYDASGNPGTLSSMITITVNYYRNGTNLVTHPNAFNSWTADASASPAVVPVVTTDAVVAPDGTTTAESVVFERSSGTFSRIGETATVTNGVNYTYGVWMKAASAISGASLRMDGNNGPVPSLTTSWQWFSIANNSTSTGLNYQILLFSSIGGSPSGPITVHLAFASLTVT